MKTYWYSVPDLVTISLRMHALWNTLCNSLRQILTAALRNSIIGTPCLLCDNRPSRYTSDPIYCDSFECSYGYALVKAAADEECRRGVCTESQCCELVCSSFDCPSENPPVENANTTMCRPSGCTANRCCKMGKSDSEGVASASRESHTYCRYSGRLKFYARRVWRHGGIVRYPCRRCFIL